MKLRHLQILILLVSLIAVQNVYGSLLIDTGNPPSSSQIAYSLGYTQFMAGEFVLENDCRITEVQGWIEYVNTISAPLSFIIYNDGGEIPGTLLYSTSLDMYGSDHAWGWYGPSGLNWTLSAGTYWLSFETQSIEFVGLMQAPVTNPLQNYAACNDQHPWQGVDRLALGIRVYGDTSPVPLPPSFFLLGCGLIGLIGIRRRFRR